MKKKVAILGSTGSIGKTTVDIIKNDKKNFEILLLTTNDNLNELTKQIRELKPKNIIINNKNNYLKLKKKFNKINIFNNFDIFLKKNKKKNRLYDICYFWFIWFTTYSRYYQTFKNYSYSKQRVYYLCLEFNRKKP